MQRAVLLQVDKMAKGTQRSLNFLTSALARDPKESPGRCVAPHDLEDAFLACIAAGRLTEAVALGEEVITRVLGNRNPDHLEGLFTAITVLQAAHVAQIARLLQLQLMNQQLAESVAAEELRLLGESYQYAGVLPQVQAMRAWAGTPEHCGEAFPRVVLFRLH